MNQLVRNEMEGVNRHATIRNTETGNNEDTNSKNTSLFDLLCVFIAAVTVVADSVTDILVLIDYWSKGRFYWALITAILIVLPAVVTQVFSLKWLLEDGPICCQRWCTHLWLLGVLERYAIFLQKSVTVNCRATNKDKTAAELNLLHLFLSYLQSAPQIIMQICSIIAIDDTSNLNLRVIAISVSFWSILWAGFMYGSNGDEKTFKWPASILRTTWFTGMLIARIAAIVLFSIVFGVWTLIPLGMHWAAMTFWIISQKTTFCHTKLEEVLYNMVMGFIYCFCYQNLQCGQTRYKLLTFYTLIVTQNLASLFFFMTVSDVVSQKKMWAVLATASVIGGTVIGLCSMLLYYRWFHPKGPMKWKITIKDDVELNNKNNFSHNRKHGQPAREANRAKSLKTAPAIASENSKSNLNPEAITPTEVQTADKKLLLDHWIGRSGTPTFTSAPITNNTMEVSGIEIHSIHSTPQILTSSNSIDSINKHTKKVKKKLHNGCSLNLKNKSPSYENVESSIDDLTASNLTLQKRRGICSSDELKDGLEHLDLGENLKDEILKGQKNDHSSESQYTDSSNKKTSSDSIDMDLDLSFSDINSSDINVFNENIVQKLCLSALKNIKVGNQDADIENIQRMAIDILKEMHTKKDKNKNVSDDILSTYKRDQDTPTEMMSVHDYENICAVNIAREAWGLRSWNGYSDIENCRHDGSVVRDRRRDTLTSASSELSSFHSQELKNSILSAPPMPKRPPTYCNVFFKCDKNDDYVNTTTHYKSINMYKDYEDTFIAKPCFVDNQHLEPIIEELDNFGDIEASKAQPRLSSKSSLVATIDEIRKVTITNSPTNIYHRRDDSWDTPKSNASCKIDTDLKRALWKEPSKFNQVNSLESLHDKDGSNYESRKKLNITHKSNSDTSLNFQEVYPKNETYSRNPRRKHKINNIKSTHPKKNNVSNNGSRDVNKDVDYLWQLVAENSLPVRLTSTEDLSTSQITSSLQSLISRDAQPSVISSATKSTAKKSIRNKPRRKFSILRERFEPKMGNECDEEMLYENSSWKPDDESKKLNACYNKSFVDDTKNIKSNESDINNTTHAEVKATIEDNNASSLHSNTKNMKEKRSVFLKQVLSPPKFNAKVKHKV